MRCASLVASVLFCAASLSPALAAPAGVSVEPEALRHYSFCIGEAKDWFSYETLDRGVLYRCHGEIAVSYFNYLGRHRVKDRRVEETNGVFVYRRISGVGRCWNKIVDEAGRPISVYGCDIYVEL